MALPLRFFIFIFFAASLVKSKKSIMKNTYIKIVTSLVLIYKTEINIKCNKGLVFPYNYWVNIYSLDIDPIM